MEEGAPSAETSDGTADALTVRIVNVTGGDFGYVMESNVQRPNAQLYKQTRPTDNPSTQPPHQVKGRDLH